MEYLMTYGWAILIIAVVLGAIYSLGLFSGASLAPRSQPGACQVIRPNGALTTPYISLAGSCTNELPQYVAQFNGANSYIGTPTSGLPLGSSARSAFAWIYVTGGTSGYDSIYAYGTFTAGGCTTNEIAIIWDDVNDLRFSGCGNDWTSALVIPQNTWTFVGFTYASGASTVTLYLNGQSQTGTLPLGPLNTVVGNSVIGQVVAAVSYFQGRIANVQVYNSSLDANSVNAIYREGIGGVPVNLQGLVGWWPLNGNANDYSGNLNNGAPMAVTYTNQWLNGYNVP